MMAKTAALSKELTGNSSIDAAKYTITHLLPPFPADAIIQSSPVHDNGYSTGKATRAIMESHSHPEESIQIQATDRNQCMIDSYLELSTAGN
ncbi:hypothetical protein BPOR_0071g00040 [Botrytis porri]|uniref:Uncharacterized protein n=1 Tax=Botrytis porri TaxID=87229 RepID=A0A4Z1L0E5_9HELO|nr:hypothetical protein BPOR_0071g00040 [Botrytis porri]